MNYNNDELESYFFLATKQDSFSISKWTISKLEIKSLDKLWPNSVFAFDAAHKSQDSLVSDGGNGISDN